MDAIRIAESTQSAQQRNIENLNAGQKAHSDDLYAEGIFSWECGSMGCG